MNPEHEIQKRVEEWKAQNRYTLPLNIDTWKIKVIKVGMPPAKPLPLGKYKALQPIATSFYKSISRIVN